MLSAISFNLDQSKTLSSGNAFKNFNYHWPTPTPHPAYSFVTSRVALNPFPKKPLSYMSLVQVLKTLWESKKLLMISTVFSTDLY